ncbi:MAG: hypothetical protein HW413_2553 [Thermoleophilia bacterium]|nr:hypothetical protein [Thermoleophilia bacterium]
MRSLARVGVVLVAAFLYTVVFYGAMVAIDISRTGFDLDKPSAIKELSAALTRAGVVIGEPDEQTRVCEFPPCKQDFRLSHEQTLALARCLHRERHLSDAGLEFVEGAPFIEISGRRSGDLVSWGFMSGGWLEQRSVWVSTLLPVGWLAGLGPVIYLVGFRLWRRRRS